MKLAARNGRASPYGAGGRNVCVPSPLYRENGAYHAGRPMNKTQFVRELQRELGDGVTPRQAERALDAVLDTIARSVLRRSLVKFRGFGSFSIKRRRARVVRHPENGSKLFVHESSTMKFRPSSRLWKK